MGTSDLLGGGFPFNNGRYQHRLIAIFPAIAVFANRSSYVVPMPYLNLDFFLETIIPKLLSITLVSLVVASVVGTIVGGIATSIWKRSQRGKTPVLPATSLVVPAILGAFICLILGMLFYEANPSSLIGGPYSGLALMIAYIMILPIGSLVGSVIGAIVGRHFPSRFQRPLWGILGTYEIATVVLYIGLALPPTEISTPPGNDPFPMVAKITGYTTIPKNMAFSPNGQQLAVGYLRRDDDVVEIWDLAAKKVAHTWHSSLGSSRTLKTVLSSLAFSHDGKEVITAAPQEVQVRDLATGNVRQRLEGGEVADPIAGGKLITLAVVDPWARKPKMDPLTLKVWDLSSGKLLQTIPADFQPANSLNLPLAISPDQRLIAFPPNAGDNLVEVWDITSGKKVTSFAVNSPVKTTALTFSPNGKQLATAIKQQLLIWDLQAGKPVKTIDKVGALEQINWSSAGIFGYGSNIDGFSFTQWDPQTGQALKTITGIGENQPIGLHALSPDRKTLAVYTKQGIKVWQVGDKVSLK